MRSTVKRWRGGHFPTCRVTKTVTSQNTLCLFFYFTLFCFLQDSSQTSFFRSMIASCISATGFTATSDSTTSLTPETPSSSARYKTSFHCVFGHINMTSRRVFQVFLGGSVVKGGPVKVTQDKDLKVHKTFPAPIFSWNCSIIFVFLGAA